MKIPFKFFALLISATLFWTSCISEDAADVRQSKIVTSYAMLYDGENDETDVSASFRFGSTFLKLSAPSEVTCNELSLKEEEILGIVSYMREFSGSVSSAEFLYRNNEGETFTNKLVLPKSIDLPDTLSQLSVSKGGLIYWVGSALDTFEDVRLTIESDHVLHHENMDSKNASFIEIRANDIPVSMLGQASIYIERVLQVNLEEAPDAGGSGNSTWRSEKFNILITE